MGLTTCVCSATTLPTSSRESTTRLEGRGRDRVRQGGLKSCLSVLCVVEQASRSQEEPIAEAGWVHPVNMPPITFGHCGCATVARAGSHGNALVPWASLPKRLRRREPFATLAACPRCEGCSRPTRIFFVTVNLRRDIPIPRAGIPRFDLRWPREDARTTRRR